MTILHEEVCEECRQLSRRVVVLNGYQPNKENIAICKACIVKAYDKIRQDEAREIAKGMRPL
jgi:hypothetical protein